MPTRAVYGSDVEWARWVEAAAGEPLNRWIRRALNEQSALEEALRRQAERDSAACDIPGPRS